MALRVGLGISDFRTLREGDFVYVDKTALIRDVIDEGAQALLLPRPRRFGKTLNLSMLRCYLEKSREPLWPLFDGLAIANAGEAYKAHFQRYPVISLSFKDVKAASFEECLEWMTILVSTAYGEHRYLLESGQLAPDEAAQFLAILERRTTETECATAIRTLSGLLHRHHGEKVVILIDEYDTPIHEGLLRGYYEHTIRFFRALLSSALKDNPHLFKAVVTGILRVAKESLFSGLNNLQVHSLLATEFATHFGFTEPEVEQLATSLDAEDRLPELRAWYNGYLFGGQVIYNPWSVLCFAKSAERDMQPFWVSTSSNDLLRQLLLDWHLGLSSDMETLLSGGTIDKPIEDGIALREVADYPDAVWSFLLFSGYLKALGLRRESGVLIGTLAIPNIEVRTVFDSLFRGWMSIGLGGENRVRALLSALLAGDAETLERYLDDLLLHAFSVHDTPDLLPEPGPRAGSGPRGRAPTEQIYQAFILGLLVNLAPRYEVRSNRESGYGRYDVMILPRTPGQPGIVLELKVLDKRRRETPKKALDSALRQLEERDYAAELRARGASPIHQMGIVFEGKRVWTRKMA